MLEKGFFNGLFDFNNDGKLSAFERAADFAAFQNMMESTKQSDEKDNKDMDDDE